MFDSLSTNLKQRLFHYVRSRSKLSCLLFSHLSIFTISTFSHFHVFKFQSKSSNCPMALQTNTHRAWLAAWYLPAWYLPAWVGSRLPLWLCCLPAAAGIDGPASSSPSLSLPLWPVALSHCMPTGSQATQWLRPRARPQTLTTGKLPK